MAKILLPISIGSSFFRSAAYSEALSGIPDRFGDRVFFVADRLQIYNRGVGAQARVGEIIKKFYRGNNYLAERSSWLTRLSKDPGLSWIRRADVVGIDSISDLSFVRIHRNVNLLYACDPAFQDDIDAWANTYLRTLDVPTGFSGETKTRLSVEFVLEEVSYNLRLRVLDHFDAEFYPGRYPGALLRLYRGNHYSASVAELTGQDVSSRVFAFFSLSGQGPRSGSWIDVTDDAQFD